MRISFLRAPHHPSQPVVSSSGSIAINDVQYKWKGYRIKFVRPDSPSPCPHRSICKRRHESGRHRIPPPRNGGGSFLKTKTPRYINLGIADEVVECAELVLPTFPLVWKVRLARERDS